MCLNYSAFGSGVVVKKAPRLGFLLLSIYLLPGIINFGLDRQLGQNMKICHLTRDDFGSLDNLFLFSIRSSFLWGYLSLISLFGRPYLGLLRQKVGSICFFSKTTGNLAQLYSSTFEILQVFPSTALVTNFAKQHK